DGMVDIRIEYADRRPGFVEVVMDIDQSYSEMASWIRGSKLIDAVELGRFWYVTVTPSAPLRQLEAKLPRLLLALESRGAVFEYVQTAAQLDAHEYEGARALVSFGVADIASRPRRLDDTGSILVSGVGTGGLAALNWNAFGDWLDDFLTGPNQ